MDTAKQSVTANGIEHALGVGGRVEVPDRIGIFFAVGSDVASLVDMLEAVHNESPRLSQYTFDANQAEKTIRNIISRHDAMGRVAILNGEVIGCMGAIISPQLTSSELVASELLLYVKPEYRGGRTALMLVRAFEKWSGDLPKVVGSSLGINDKLAIDFYKRLGYDVTGMSLTKG